MNRVCEKDASQALAINVYKMRVKSLKKKVDEKKRKKMALQRDL